MEITHWVISSITGPGEALTRDDVVRLFDGLGYVTEARNGHIVAWESEADLAADGSGDARRVAIASPVHSRPVRW